MKKKRIYTGVATLILYTCFFVPVCQAQPFPDIQFARLNTLKALPANIITSVFKDSRGLVWFGSETNGLLRYDGKNLKSYRDDGKNKVVIGQGYAGVVCEDGDGWLWVSTANGLYHFDPLSEMLESFHHDENDTTSLASDDKPRPFVDSRKRLWISSNGGLQQFNPVTKKFINYAIPAPVSRSQLLQAKSIGNLLEDAAHRIWAASAYGLYLVDTVTLSMKLFSAGIYAFITGMVEDNKHRIWISFWGGGLKVFDPSTVRFTNITDATGITLCVNKWIDGNNREWICYAENYNFRLVDPHSWQTNSYTTDTESGNALMGNEITCIYSDEEQRLWICTNTGVFLVDRKLQLFSSHLLYKDLRTDVNNHFGEPRSLLVQQNGYLLSTWYAGHLYRYNKNWQLQEIIKSIPPGSASFNSRVINTIQQDESGNTWYGTDSGLVKQSGNKFTVYLPPDSFHLVEDRFAARNMLKRKDGHYWVRFFRRGVYVFDAAAGRFIKNYRAQYRGEARCMEYDKDGQLWLGTSEGLYLYRPAGDSFERIPIHPPEKSDARQFNIIHSLYFDNDNAGWIGTYNGLVKMNAQKKVMDFISNPLTSRCYMVWRILEDSTGILWLLSSSGLLSYNKHLHSFRLFTSDNGLPENFAGFPGVFNWLNDSSIAVGSTGVIVSFNPYRVTAAGPAAPVLFTDVAVDGKRQAVAAGLQTIIAGPGARNINIHFALLNYTAPQQNKLYYRVFSGNDDQWNETSDGEFTLLNLPPGNYRLQVKGVANGDIRAASIAEMAIEIKPWWYQTVFFRLLLTSLLGTLLYLFIRRRIKAGREAAAIRQRIAETEMAALKAQMNPHFIFNCISCIDGLIQDNDKYHATVYLNKFAKLIRNVLDSSRENTVELSRDIETLRLYIDLEHLRSERKYKTAIHIAAAIAGSDYQVPPLIIQPFIENAIHHGLRNRKDNDGLLTVNIDQSEDYIWYTIYDNGIGRKAAGGLHAHDHQSYGIRMSTERIRMFNKERSPSVQIEDLYTNGIAAGTRVTVKLKIR